MCLTPLNQRHVALMETRLCPPSPPPVFSQPSLVQLISALNLLNEKELEDGLCKMLQHFFKRPVVKKTKTKPCSPPQLYSQLWHQTYFISILLLWDCFNSSFGAVILPAVGGGVGRWSVFVRIFYVPLSGSQSPLLRCVSAYIMDK